MQPLLLSQLAGYLVKPGAWLSSVHRPSMLTSVASRHDHQLGPELRRLEQHQLASAHRSGMPVGQRALAASR